MTKQIAITEFETLLHDPKMYIECIDNIEDPIVYISSILEDRAIPIILEELIMQSLASINTVLDIATIAFRTIRNKEEIDDILEQRFLWNKYNAIYRYSAIIKCNDYDKPIEISGYLILLRDGVYL